MNIDVMGNLVDHITRWNTERADIAEHGADSEFGLTDEETAEEEANRDSAVDLLHSIAMLIEQAKAAQEKVWGEPWCNHDAPAVIDGVCECGERVPKPKKRRNRSA